VGDPRDPQTTTGALVSEEHLDKVKFYLDKAIADGGVVQCGYGVDALEHNLPSRNKNVSSICNFLR